MSLKRHGDLGRVGEFFGRDAVEADPGCGLGDMYAGGDGERAAHAEPHHRDLIAVFLQVHHRAA
jgi:hypothetical protein